MKLNNLNSDLILTDSGIWQSRNKAAVSYPSDGNDRCFEVEDESFWFRHRNNCIVAVMQSFPFDTNQPIFDVGGGNGYVTKGIQEAGMQSILIEPGEQGAINARSRGVKNIVCSTLQDANFDKESISAIGMFDVVEHIECDEKFLKNVHDLMVCGGKIYLTVPAYSWLWSLEDVNAGHFRRYTKNSLQQLVTNSGFDILYASYIFSFLPLPIFFLRSLPYRLKLNNLSSNKNPANDHNKQKGIIGRLLDKLLQRELLCIRSSKSMRFGGSVILVATKNQNK